MNTWWTLPGTLSADGIYAFRRLMQTKIVSAAGILSLALAAGACLAAFRLIDALLLRPLPVANPERLFAVAFRSANALDGRTTGSRHRPDPATIRARNRVG
jgi:putative ABC transport system permease protein